MTVVHPGRMLAQNATCEPLGGDVRVSVVVVGIGRAGHKVIRRLPLLRSATWLRLRGTTVSLALRRMSTNNVPSTR